MWQKFILLIVYIFCFFDFQVCLACQNCNKPRSIVKELEPILWNDFLFIFGKITGKIIYKFKPVFPCFTTSI